MSIRIKLLFQIFILINLFSCAQNDVEKIFNEPLATACYEQAQKHSNLDSSFYFLKKSFEYGKADAMEIVLDKKLNRLIADPQLRPKIRSLLKKHAKKNHAEMVTSHEPGERIFIRGRLLNESNNKPVKDASVELIQADNKGLYFEEEFSKFNPRIFSYLKTNSDGEFSVFTIKPASYKDDDNKDVIPHIHFNLEGENYRPYNSEFTFSDDSLFQINNTEGTPIAILENRDSIKHYNVLIYLQEK